MESQRSQRSQGADNSSSEHRRPVRTLPPPAKSKAPADSTGNGLGLENARSLDSHVRSRLEFGLGSRLPDLRIYTGADAAGLASRESARAVTYGRDIAFGSGEFRPGTFSGDALLAHEAAHALQQQKGNGNQTERDSESEATRASATAFSRMAGNMVSPAALGGGALSLRRCGKSDVQRALEGTIPWTGDLARKALDQYRGMSSADRQKTFDRYYPTGVYQTMLAALTPEDAAGSYADVIRDITAKAQLAATLGAAKASGMGSLDQMAQAQAGEMQKRNEAAAKAANPVGPPPTQAQVAAQQTTQVAQTSIAPGVAVMSPADIAKWTAAANVEIDRVVAYAAAHHPELHLSKADFIVDVPGIELRGKGVIADEQVIGGKAVARVGETFARYSQANPGYVLSVVVHELHGHIEYGPYGAPGTELGLSVYDAAAAKMKGYTQPAAGSEGRRSELDAYAYQETEIYSVLRSYNYHVSPSAADSGKLPDIVNPDALTTWHVKTIKDQWEPHVAEALLHGLYRRLVLDPRISAAALHAFERAVRANYTGPDASTAGTILQ